MADNNSVNNGNSPFMEERPFNEVICSLTGRLGKGGFVYDRMLITSYGLDHECLYSILSDVCMNSTENFDPRKADVFYDSEASGFDSSRYCWGQRVYMGTRREKGAFHPKLILFRYINKNSNKERFGAVISSRNITSSKMIDGYVSLTSDDVDINGSAAEGSTEPNGERLYGFIHDELYKYARKDNSAEYKGLERAEFRSGRSGETVKFMDSAELGETIKVLMEDKKELTVFSPFVSYNGVDPECVIVTSLNYAGSAMKIVYGGFTKSSDPNVKGKVLCFKNNEDNTVGVHVKLYCWTEEYTPASGETAADNGAERKTKIRSVMAIGSSNFTVNGLSNVNTELNCLIKREDGGELYKSVMMLADELEPEISSAEELPEPSGKDTDVYKLLMKHFTEHKIKVSECDKGFCYEIDSRKWYFDSFLYFLCFSCRGKKYCLGYEDITDMTEELRKKAEAEFGRRAKENSQNMLGELMDRELGIIRKPPAENSGVRGNDAYRRLDSEARGEMIYIDSSDGLYEQFKKQRSELSESCAGETDADIKFYNKLLRIRNCADAALRLGGDAAEAEKENKETEEKSEYEKLKKIAEDLMPQVIDRICGRLAESAAEVLENGDIMSDVSFINALRERICEGRTDND